MSILTIDSARRTIGDQTLFSQLELTLGPGRSAGIIGANGSGKSTLLRCIVGDDRLDEGAITVCGAPPDDTSPVFRAAVSADLGEQATFLDLTVAEHLTMMARAHRCDADIDAILAGAGLSGLGDRYPHALSSGQGRRFALAATLLRPFQLLVLDEPEYALDISGQRWVAHRLTAATESGAAVIIATHSPALAGQCDIQVELS